MPEATFLRPVRDDELPLMLAWRNAPAVRQNMFTRHEIGLAEHLAWWARTRARCDAAYHMAVVAGRACGIVAYTTIDAAHAHAAWAFYAAPDAPRGAGSWMELLALDQAFGPMALHRLHCEVLAFNTPVLRLHQKFGFQVEGTQRAHHRGADGLFIDVLRLGILADEWRAGRPAMLGRLQRSLADATTA